VDFIRERNEGDADPNADEGRRDWLIELSKMRLLEDETSNG
jgi:hypothetical protein